MSDKLSFREFPILMGGKVPWAMVAPHEYYAKKNHGGQTLETLAQRGGLSWGEMLCVLRNERVLDNLLSETEARLIVKAMIEEWMKAHV